ncbi:hypothetical protein KQ51_01378 [Candidatus Izimaplasma bacterium HR1]|uniref:hypothetical protein n=1 Tax=Candidatus Izimoplasma sp. HR1 TaxID=1541959 RepID=UPI0004F7E20F|nr:hypothetical protein KQ51_01378 [Candidatus Izimaplasma bacterium HR1]
MRVRKFLFIMVITFITFLSSCRNIEYDQTKISYMTNDGILSTLDEDEFNVYFGEGIYGVSIFLDREQIQSLYEYHSIPEDIFVEIEPLYKQQLITEHGSYFNGMFVERYNLIEYNIIQSPNDSNIVLLNFELSFEELMIFLVPLVEDIECKEILLIDDFQ